MNEEHLRCEVCEANPTVARLDGVVTIVCHCTHVDGRIDPVEPGRLLIDVLPDGWNYREQGASGE